jgi:hypothetical protein
MKLIPFSPDLCQQLLDRGYCHFVKRYRDEEIIAEPNITTFEAVRDREHPSIPIQQIMHLPPDTVNQYYVLLRD